MSMMETSMDMGDQFSLVSRRDSTEFSKRRRYHCWSFSCNLHTLVCLFALVLFCAILITLVVVTVIVLQKQNSKLSELTERIDTLHGVVANNGVLSHSLNSSKVAGAQKSLIVPHTRSGEKNSSKLKQEERIAKQEKISSRLLHLLHVIRSSLTATAITTTSGFKASRIQVLGISETLDNVLRIVNASRNAVLDDLTDSLREHRENINDHFLDSLKATETKMLKSMNKIIGDLDRLDKTLEIISTIQSNMTGMKNLSSDTIAPLLRHSGSEYDTARTMNATLGGLISRLQNMEDAMERLEKLFLNLKTPSSTTKVSLPTSSSGADMLLRLQTKQLIDLTFTIKEFKNRTESNFESIFDRLNGSGVEMKSDNQLQTFCADGENRCLTSSLRSKHCYRIFLKTVEPLEWIQAHEKCRGIGGYLAEIDSVAELEALRQFVSPTEAYWLGGTDRHTENKWIWHHSGKPITLNVWQKGEPNNAGGEDCLLSAGMASWNDVPCQLTFSFICELEDEHCR